MMNTPIDMSWDNDSNPKAARMRARKEREKAFASGEIVDIKPAASEPVKEVIMPSTIPVTPTKRLEPAKAEATVDDNCLTIKLEKRNIPVTLTVVIDDAHKFSTTVNALNVTETKDTVSIMLDNTVKFDISPLTNLTVQYKGTPSNVTYPGGVYTFGTITCLPLIKI